MNNNWVKNGNDYYLREVSQQIKILPKGVYKLNQNRMTKELYLSQVQDEFSFPYKVYNIETGFVDRVKKTYDNTTGNLGMLLNGIKGTGKTVTAQMVCNKLGLPVIIVHQPFEDIPSFLNELQQDVIVFFDEYEKMYRDYDNDILTVMDGVLNTKFRKVFLLTTNKLYINDNLIQRPGRLRYIKTFSDLPLAVIMEIVDDKLVHKQFRDDCIEFISKLEVITVDIVKAVIEEVNIHEEPPENFKDIFNIKKLESGVNIFIQGKDGLYSKNIETDVNISPFKFTPECVNENFYINHIHAGEIVQYIDEHTIVVRSDNSDYEMDSDLPVEDVEEELEEEVKPKRRKKAQKPKDGIIVRTYRIEYVNKKHKSFNSFYAI